MYADEFKKLLELPVLTTGQIARLLHCAPRSVTKMIDSGRLKGYRLTTSDARPGDRRVSHEEFRAFCRRNHIPLVFPEDRPPEPPPVAEAALCLHDAAA